MNVYKFRLNIFSIFEPNSLKKISVSIILSHKCPEVLCLIFYLKWPLFAPRPTHTENIKLISDSNSFCMRNEVVSQTANFLGKYVQTVRVI